MSTSALVVKAEIALEVARIFLVLTDVFAAMVMLPLCTEEVARMSTNASTLRVELDNLAPTVLVALSAAVRGIGVCSK